MTTEKAAPDKLSLVVYAGHFDTVHYALVMASAAAAIGRPVTLFFSMGACEALRRPGEDGVWPWTRMPLSEGDGTGGDRDRAYAEKGVATLDELWEACVQLGVRFMVCEMGLRAQGLEDEPLRDDAEIERSGVVTFIDDASKDGAMLLI